MNKKEEIARVLYECERRRAENCQSFLEGAAGRPLPAASMEPWEECKDVFLSDADAILAALRASAAPEEGKREALEDLKTHREAWRVTIVRTLGNSPPASVDDDDKSYWQHELAAFDRTFAALPSDSGKAAPVAVDKQISAFHNALSRYPDSFEALHFFWNEALAGEPQTALAPATEGEGPWCQPMDCGKHTPRKFLLYFEDTDRGIAVFDDETEARKAFSKANTAWNCYLFGSLALSSSPSVGAGTQDKEEK